MFASIRSALALFALAAVAVRSTDAASANCTLETADLSSNPTIQLQMQAVDADIANQMKVCLQEQKSPCDVDADYSSYTTACEAEGGQVYEPVTTFQCKQGVYTTTYSQAYITCVGASCTTEEFTEITNEKMQNVTNAVKSVYDVDGIDCALSFSGAKTFGFAVSMVIMAGSMMMMMV